MLMFLLDKFAGKIDLDQMDADGYTPLVLATKKGNVAVADILISRGANVNAKSPKGVTPLHQASANGDIALMKSLLQHGAKVNLPPVDPNEGDFVGSALHWACAENRFEAVKLLLESGADPNARDSHQGTPLHQASAQGFIDVVKFLLEHKADPNAQAHDSSTALHLAVEFDKLRIARRLVKYGADITLRDSSGETPVDAAKRKNSPHLIHLMNDTLSHTFQRDIDQRKQDQQNMGSMSLEERTAKAVQYKELANQVFTRDSNYVRALFVYGSAIQLDPGNHVLFSNRSACYFNLGRFDKAVADAERCIALNPGWSKGYWRLAAALVQLRRFPEANRLLDQGLSIDPTNKELLAEKERLGREMQTA